eukprot:758198-Prymnesium_polylepis.1
MGTGAVSPTRDPTSWEFGIGGPNGSFELLSVVQDVVPPIGRSTSYGRFWSILPPPPLPALPPAPPLLPGLGPPGLPPYPPPPPMGDAYMFIFTNTLDPTSSMIALAEIILFDADGQQIPVVQVLNPGGEAANLNQLPSAVVDGWNGSKWLDTNFNQSSRLVLMLPESQRVASYELITSPGDNNANRRRDPTGWEFGIFRN